MNRELDLRKIRQQLQMELQRLRGKNRANSSASYQRSGANLDRDDLAHNYSVRERQRALNEVAQVKKIEIEKALKRISQGTYGQCTKCSNPIEPARLEIIPYAVRCISCELKRK